MAELKCLRCGQTRAEVKRNNTFCGIVSGYEYQELEAEWPRHHWADWSNKELERFGIRAEAFEKYRREPVMRFRYTDCNDTVAGHRYPLETNVEFHLDVDQCFQCGHRKAPEPVIADG